MKIHDIVDSISLDDIGDQVDEFTIKSAQMYRKKYEDVLAENQILKRRVHSLESQISEKPRIDAGLCLDAPI